MSYTVLRQLLLSIVRIIYLFAKENTIAFSFYITKIYLSDVNIVSPVKSHLYNLKIMMLKLTHVAFPRKISYPPFP